MALQRRAFSPQSHRQENGLAPASRIGPLSRRAAALLAVFAMAAALMLGALHGPAAAQESQGWSLRNLFAPRRSERVYPPAPTIKRTKQKKKAPATPAATAEPKTPAPEKDPDARVVLVVGDFMAGGLAEGIEQMFAENPGIKVVDRSKGSSGFVRDDFYDWPKEIGALLQSEKPAVVVVMLGSNDRQQMRIGDEREAPRTDVWTIAYEARTEAFGKVISAAKVPYLWVGVPAFKANRMTTDMLAFNEIYKTAAERSGGEFIDIWDGFVDEAGAFVSTGPDVNGQPVRLRADDGINLTRAGKRKVAFYTEKPLLKLLKLESATGVPAAPLPPGPPVEGMERQGEATPATIDHTQPMLLSDPALDGGSELLGATSPGQGAMPRGIAEKPSPGRADDFTRPRAEAPASPAARTATSAIAP